MVGTIFEATKVPLPKWFYAIYLMATNKAGTSAAQLERELGVKYDTAWRMMHAIRTLMESPQRPVQGSAEVDELFYHPNVWKRSSAKKKYAGYSGTGSRSGEILVGMLERSTGIVKVFHVKTIGARVILPLIKEHVKVGTTIHTDGYRAYLSLPKMGYDHHWTDHGKLQFYTPGSSTQRIENFWSTFKPRLKGTYKHVSPRYLQSYANEYAWRYSNRGKPSMFWSLMARIGK